MGEKIDSMRITHHKNINNLIEQKLKEMCKKLT